MRPIREQSLGQKVGESFHAIKQLQRRPAPSSDGGSIWALASASSMTMSDAGPNYLVTFDNLFSNSATAFTEDTVASGRFQWVSLSEPGYYWLKGILALSGEYNTNFSRIDATVSISGAVADLQSNLSLTDFIGPKFTRVSEQDAGENAHPGYYTEVGFYWNPPDQINDLDFENPLKLGLAFTVAGGPATFTLGGADLFITKVASTGYTQLFP